MKIARTPPEIIIPEPGDKKKIKIENNTVWVDGVKLTGFFLRSESLTYKERNNEKNNTFN